MDGQTGDNWMDGRRDKSMDGQREGGREGGVNRWTDLRHVGPSNVYSNVISESEGSAALCVRI